MTLRTEYLAAIEAHAGIDIDRVEPPPQQRLVMLNGLHIRYLECVVVK